ncbi:hypothetical protein ACTL6P_10275 [Endozoicomonas acroporae]|uniref:hypothetical protein n=1 Tax=Endozoicomonas acroporae TaxID=1701104 RepID=UPI000C791F4E|nr:hypothetical protein [Endozoicomonas acroporae]
MFIHGTMGNTGTTYKVPLSGFDKTSGHAFGMKVEEQDGVSLELQIISNDEGELASDLFKDNEDYVLLIKKDELEKLQVTNPEVFTGLYNARPVPEASESVFSRVCTLVADIISAYLNTGQR